MESPQGKSESPKEICSITIAFPVIDDDMAIDIRKKIKTLLGDTPEVMIDFRIRGLPANVLPVR